MPVSPKKLIDVLRQNKNKQLAASKIVESSPRIIPILPKLIQDRSIAPKLDSDKLTVNKSLFLQIYQKLNTQRKNNEYILKLFPDIELAIQILVSSILSPKTLTSTDLIFTFSSNVNLPPDITALLLKNITEHLETYYEIKQKLPIILREVLFTSGSYPIAVIPEASIDEVINSDIIPSFSSESFTLAVESVINRFTKPINLIPVKEDTTKYHTKKPVNEFISKIVGDDRLRITDNPNVFKLSGLKSALKQKVIRHNLKSNTTISQESLDKLNYIDIFRSRSNTPKTSDIEYIKTKNETLRKSIGRPLVIKLPHATTIPVFSPGDTSKHIGYFVLLDGSGNPLELDLNENDEQYLFRFFETSENTLFNLTQKAYKNLITNVESGIDQEQLFSIYREVIEKKLYDTVKNSLYGDNIEIANRNDIYFIMFTRALKEQKTSLLFIPKELVTYFAFYYNDIGMGKTLLENISILSSIRSILLFSKTMAYVKQAIDVTKVNITLDQNDPDPEKTIEQIQDSVLKLRQNFFPLGINNPVDLVDWIQRSGLQFAYDNNPLLPDVKIDFENVNIQHTIPQSELEEELRKQMIIALGLSPETIDNGFSPEFATSVVNNNILLSKRVMLYQSMLVDKLKDFIQSILYNDEELRSKLKTILFENKDSIISHLPDKLKTNDIKDEIEFASEFIDYLSDNIEPKFPSPDITNIENLTADFDMYKETLDKVIDSIASSEFLNETIAGEFSQNVDTLKALLKHHLLRKWMADNNFFPEALEFSLKDKPGEQSIELIKDYTVSILKNANTLFNSLSGYKSAIDADLNSEEKEEEI